jgi:hypothetical protein
MLQNKLGSQASIAHAAPISLNAASSALIANRNRTFTRTPPRDTNYASIDTSNRNNVAGEIEVETGAYALSAAPPLGTNSYLQY